MQLRIKTRKIVNTRAAVKADDCAVAAWILYLSFEPITLALTKFLPGYLPAMIAYGLMYAPLCLSLYLQKQIPFDFILLFFAVVWIFAVTYSRHPEYYEWFFVDSYRLTRRIFRPDRPLYCYLFIRAFQNPKAMLKAFKYSAFLLLLYNSYLLLVALRRGYWIVNSLGYDMPYPYDLNYGYSHLFLFSTFMTLGFREHKKRYVLLGLISALEVFLGGSRGPILYMALLLAFLYGYRMKERRGIKKFLMATAALLGIAAVWMAGLDQLTQTAGTLLQSLGLGDSRTVQSLLNGSISDDNGRLKIWKFAVDMIRADGLFGLGYGAYGDRYWIRPLFIWVGYCHNVFLELLIDYGCIRGGLLILILLIASLKMLFWTRDTTWRDLFLILFIGACKLLLSGSYWYSQEFWGAIAVAVSYSRHQRRLRRRRSRKGGRP